MRWFNSSDDPLKSRRQTAKEQKEELSRLRAETNFEKSDLFALVLGALWALAPFIFIMLIGYYVISMWIFG